MKYKRGDIRRGYLMSPEEMENYGYSIVGKSTTGRRLRHPCGKHLSVLSKNFEKFSDGKEREFRMKDIYDMGSKRREIWSCLDGEFSVYGGVIADLSSRILTDDLFEI